MTHNMKLSGAAILFLFACLCGTAILAPSVLKWSTSRPDLSGSLASHDTQIVPQAGNRVYDNQHSRIRPLFYAMRAPLPGEPVSSQTERTIVIEGIVGGKDGLAAGLRISGQTELLWLRTGDKTGDWTVDTINFRSVKLRRGADVQVLSLR